MHDDVDNNVEDINRTHYKRVSKWNAYSVFRIVSIVDTKFNARVVLDKLLPSF